MPIDYRKHSLSESKCGHAGCGLPPRYHAITLPAYAKDENGIPVPTDKPAHAFRLNGAVK